MRILRAHSEWRAWILTRGSKGTAGSLRFVALRMHQPIHLRSRLALGSASLLTLSLLGRLRSKANPNGLDLVRFRVNRHGAFLQR